MISKDQISKANILIVDDEQTSNQLLTKILKNDGYKNITAITDSTQACDLYREMEPDLFILDLHMPNVTGFDVMETLQKECKDDYLPIIIITGDETQETRLKALDLGGKDFLNKPYNSSEVLCRIRNLIEVRLLHNEIFEHNKKLEEKVSERTKELYQTQLDVINRLSRAIEFRDSETGMHIVRMSHYSACLAAKAGLSAKECEFILTASPLQDIGKIGIPDRILCKKGSLTGEEWEIMKKHTIIGSEMLSGSKSKFLNFGKEIALTHHERWDGTGYPRGLKGEEIPIIGRICGLCDVFDALTTERPYKKAWTVKEAVDEIVKGKGTHFDPKLVDLFVECLPEIERIKNENEDPENLGNH